jgi:sporulation protein YlmC with PRC-barrel domain
MTTHRLSQLLGSAVVDANGHDHGHVIDVRVSPLTATDPGSIDALLVSTHRRDGLFAYHRDDQNRPLALRGLLRSRQNSFLVSWRDVDAWDPAAHRVLLRAGASPEQQDAAH